MSERPKEPDSKSGERYALRGFESLSLRMEHLARCVLVLLPFLLCGCGAGSSSFAPSWDTNPDLVEDVTSGADTHEDVSADAPPPADLPELAECLTDDDCQGLALAIPLCQVVICDAGACTQVAAADGMPCHSGTSCKDPGTCAKGSCLEPVTVCEDGDPCTGTTCEPGIGCLHEPLDEVPCDDGDLCTATDLCVAGLCVGAGEILCDDGEVCTLDLCDPWFGCVHEDLDALCDDGDPCTGADTCVFGACVGMTDVCECDTDADCAGFANACFGAYTCDEAALPRVCVPMAESETPCPDVAPCLAAVCDPSTEACVPVPKADGTPCADPLACVTEGSCVAGICVGEPVVCEGGGLCTAPVCVPGEGCTEAPEPGPCDDDDPCTVNDWCVDGACAALGTDCGAAPAALFRVTTLQWGGPGLAFTAPGGIEIGLEEAMDVALTQSLGDSYAPLDLLLGVSPLDTKGPSSLLVGAEACLRDDVGLVTSCPWPGTGVSLSGLDYCLAGDPCEEISGAPPAPAFGVLGEVAVALSLGASLGGSVEPAAMEVVGQLQGLPDPAGIAAGTLSLFLTEDAAALATVAPPLMAPMTLAELLHPGALTEVDGLQGWWVHLDFEALRVPIIP
jgi:hypothetical protein